MKTRANRDDAILDAAHRVFQNDPSATMSAISAAAGIGMSALYLRFENKEVLLQALSLRGLRTFVEITSTAAEDDAPFDRVFPGWCEDLLMAATLTLGNRLAGSFTPTSEHYRLTQEAVGLASTLFEHAQNEKIVAKSVNLNDLMLIIEAMGAVQIGAEARSREVQVRLLHIALAGLRHLDTEEAIPSPIEPEEMVRRWSSNRSPE